MAGTKRNISSRRMRRNEAEAKTGSVDHGLRFLMLHCYEPIKVTDVAQAAKLSKRKLHKTFLQHLGQTPGRELRRMRIERAKQLLASSNRGLLAVAKLSGYRSLNSFCVAFKRVTGKAPGAYRSRFTR